MEEKMKKVKLDENVCIGCGMCVSTATKTFDFDEDHAKVINNEVTKEAEEAAECCPVGAISIEEENE